MSLKLKSLPGFLIITLFLLTLGCKKTTETPKSTLEPPVVTTDSIYYNQGQTARCNATVTDTGAGKILRFGICWGTSHFPVVDNQNSNTVDATTMNFNQFYCNIGPIVSGNTYYVRAFARNKDGYGYGAEKQFVSDSIPVNLLDGYYIKGAMTAYPDFNTNAMMTVAKNEVTQTLRSSLLELYIPIRAGSEGFSIVKVAGSARVTYGPETSFGIVTGADYEEPKVPFQRGPVSSTTTSVFTVPTDGFYHVIFDYALNKAAVVPVQWGMIGSATPNGWASDTMMIQSAFHPTNMLWTLTNLPLIKAEWKFRYSHGWKVEIDTLDINPFNWVKVNTNMGGTISQPEPGGSNIFNTIAGMYTCTLTYQLGSGYSASLVRTGNLPATDWTSVKCDAVGDGISAENPSAIPDPSSWQWGNKLLADAGGIPAKNGNVYTWQWTNVILEAYNGFKIRSENGVPPPVGGANFNAGFSSLNTALSSAEIVDGGGGNLQATTKGSYTIKLTIDAGDSDKKMIIITKN